MAKKDTNDCTQPEIINRILTFSKPCFILKGEKVKIVSIDTFPYKITLRSSEGLKSYSQEQLIKELKL
jgi:hypothetical protein